MSDGNALEIADDELLFHRVSVNSKQYDPDSKALSPKAFQVYERDKTGLSITRGRSERHPDFLTAEDEASRGPSSGGYYVAVLRAGDLRAAGIDIVAVPENDNPGHAELPQMRAENRRSNETKEMMQLLVRLCLRVEGPFDRDRMSVAPSV